MGHRAHLVCAFVEPQAVGERFAATQWPLHATVVPWFHLKTSRGEFTSSLQERLANSAPFIAHVGFQGHSRLGARKVSLLEPDQWQDLHEAVLNVVSSHAGTLATKLFIGPQYIPHVTFQDAGHLSPGDEFACNSLYIVEQQTGHRKVVNRLNLGDETAT